MDEQIRKLIAAYMECSDEIQKSVREMLVVATDSRADKQERDMAIGTIVEALNPEGRIFFEREWT